MSYAEAASSGTSYGSQHESQQNSKKEDFTTKKCLYAGQMVYHASSLLTNCTKEGFWKYITGLQRVDFNQGFAIVINDANIKDKLGKSGLEINSGALRPQSFTKMVILILNGNGFFSHLQIRRLDTTFAQKLSKIMKFGLW